MDKWINIEYDTSFEYRIDAKNTTGTSKKVWIWDAMVLDVPVGNNV